MLSSPVLRQFVRNTFATPGQLCHRRSPKPIPRHAMCRATPAERAALMKRLGYDPANLPSTETWQKHADAAFGEGVVSVVERKR